MNLTVQDQGTLAFAGVLKCLGPMKQPYREALFFALALVAVVGATRCGSKGQESARELGYSAIETEAVTRVRYWILESYMADSGCYPSAYTPEAIFGLTAESDSGHYDWVRRAYFLDHYADAEFRYHPIFLRGDLSCATGFVLLSAGPDGKLNNVLPEVLYCDSVPQLDVSQGMEEIASRSRKAMWRRDILVASSNERTYPGSEEDRPICH